MHPLSLFTSTNLVLLFHGVPSRQWFEDSIRSIANFYQFVSLKEIEQYFYDDRRMNGRCHISFDDGDISFYEHAFPVLKKMNIPASVFVSPKIIVEEGNFWFQELEFLQKRVGDKAVKATIAETLGLNDDDLNKYQLFSIFKNMPMATIQLLLSAVKKKHHLSINEKFNITKAQLQAVVASRIVTVGAHTMSHPILPNESNEAVEAEITGSVTQLSELTDHEIRYFAYPNGIPVLDFREREQAILKRNGIKLAFSTYRGYFDKQDNILSIPRASLSASLSKARRFIISTELLLLPAWDLIRSLAGKGKTAALVEELERIEMARSMPLLPRV